MLLFTVRRLLSFLITLALVSIAIFITLEILPGDPAAIMLGTEARPDTLSALRAELGLDRPAMTRYLEWAGGLLTGDLGMSYTYRVPVSGLVIDRLFITVPLAVLAIALSTLLGLPLGVLAASHHGRFVDRFVMVFSQIGVAIPNFWYGLALILLFSIGLGWFSAGGFPGWGEGVGQALKALLLPAFAMALPQAAILARVTRSAVLDVLGEDFVRTARAKGLTRRAALWRHATPNALIPVVTVMGLQFSFLIAGAVLIETVFTLPGLGRLVVLALAQRDLAVIKTVVMLLASLVVTVNFCVDLLYGALDPRLKGRQ